MPMTTQAVDRRRVGRRSIPGVSGTLHRPGDVAVLDVGLYGLAIETAADLEVGRRYFLEVRHGNAVASVEVAVCWTSVRMMSRERGRLLPLTRAGVAFTEVVLDEHDGGIWRWILPDANATAH